MKLGTKAIEVRCDTCEAAPGDKCVGMVLRGGGFHQARIDAAVRQTKLANQAARAARGS